MFVIFFLLKKKKSFYEHSGIGKSSRECKVNTQNDSLCETRLLSTVKFITGSQLFEEITLLLRAFNRRWTKVHIIKGSIFLITQKYAEKSFSFILNNFLKETTLWTTLYIRTRETPCKHTCHFDERWHFRALQFITVNIYYFLILLK